MPELPYTPEIIHKHYQLLGRILSKVFLCFLIRDWLAFIHKIRQIHVKCWTAIAQFWAIWYLKWSKYSANTLRKVIIFTKTASNLLKWWRYPDQNTFSHQDYAFVMLQSCTKFQPIDVIVNWNQYLVILQVLQLTICKTAVGFPPLAFCRAWACFHNLCLLGWTLCKATWQASLIGICKRVKRHK